MFYGKVTFNIDVFVQKQMLQCCLLYTSDAADERSSVDLGGRRIIKKNNIEYIGIGTYDNDNTHRIASDIKWRTKTIYRKR